MQAVFSAQQEVPHSKEVEANPWGGCSTFEPIRKPI